MRVWWTIEQCKGLLHGTLRETNESVYNAVMNIKIRLTSLIGP